VPPVVILQQSKEIRLHKASRSNYPRPFDAKRVVADGLNGKMNMRRLFRAGMLAWATLSVCGIANAADLGLPAPQVAPIPVYRPFSWTGFYAGGNIGLAWTQGDFTDSLGNTFTGSSAQSVVFAGGGQVGANYQFNNWLVVGVEGTFDAMTHNNNSSDSILIGNSSVRVSVTDSWLTTVAARVGLVAAERALFYAKGGGAWVGGNEFTVTNTINGVSITGSNSSTVGGWVAGAGFEYAFAPNWTAKVEYDFIALSNTSITVPAGTVGTPADTISTNNHDIQMLTIGFNYLFN
jgi:outer membrane immunogenic protein